jgi:preprotein translocase subunit Sss1
MTCRGYDQGALAQKPVWEGFETMLRIFAVTLLAIALSVGFA